MRKKSETPAGMTKKALAALAGYSDEWLRRVNKELPEGKKLFVPAEGGGYDPATFVQRWVEYNVESMEQDGTEDLDAVKARHELVKMQKTQLQVQRMRGDLVDVADVKRLWGEIGNTISRRIMNIPARIAPEIAGIEDAGEIASILDGAVREELEILSASPIPDYARAADAEDEEEETEKE